MALRRPQRSIPRLRLRPVVAAALCALACAAPASASFPDYAGEPRLRAYEPEGLRRAAPRPARVAVRRARWGRLHAGQDIAVLRTDQCTRPRSGVVRAVGYLPEHSGYGNVVEIRHEGGLVTMYAHLSSALVRVGQRVERGQLIARAGCTGSCTGPHLHFEVHKRGRPVDPAPYLETPCARIARRPGRLAQLGEHQLDKLGVTGSSPSTAHLVRESKVLHIVRSALSFVVVVIRPRPPKLARFGAGLPTDFPTAAASQSHKMCSNSVRISPLAGGSCRA